MQKRGTAWTKLGGGLQVTSVQPDGASGLSDERLLKERERDSDSSLESVDIRFAVKTSDFECGQHDFFFLFFQLSTQEAQGAVEFPLRGMV